MILKWRCAKKNKTWELLDQHGRICGGVQRTPNGWSAVAGYDMRKGNKGMFFPGSGPALGALRRAKAWALNTAFKQAGQPNFSPPLRGHEATGQGHNRDLFEPCGDMFDTAD